MNIKMASVIVSAFGMPLVDIGSFAKVNET